MYHDLLIAFGGSSILLVLITFLVRSIIKHILSKDIERYKFELKSQTDKAIFEHKSKFANIYMKQAEIIAKLYKYFVILIKELNVIDSIIREKQTRSQPLKIPSDEASKLSDLVFETLEYFNENKLYLPTPLAQNISELLSMCIAINIAGVFSQADASADNLPYDIKQKLATFDRQDLFSIISKLIVDFQKKADDIEKEFKDIVGIK